jgi:hypothetical protein
MAITPSVKQPRGYGLSGYDVFQEIAKGDRPPLGDGGRVAPWLPVMQQEERSDEYFVILAGRMVSIDRTITNRDENGDAYVTSKFSGGFAPRIVPCNSSGSAQTITYGADDVGYTIDVDDQDDFVTAAADASATLPANSPVGWAQHNMYSEAIRYARVNYDKDLEIRTVLCNYYVEVALIGLSGQDSLEPGALVKPYTQGNYDAAESALYQGLPTYFNPASDSVDQIGGRVIMMAEIPYGVSSRSRYDLVRGVRGLSLPGVDTTGKPRWLSMDQATHYVRINITMM